MTTVTRHVEFARNGHGKKLVQVPVEETKPRGRTRRISKLMALAIRYDEMLRKGEVTSLSELAQLAHVTQPRMTQIMNLLHLAPDIQEELLFLPEVLEGRDLVTERDMRVVAAEVEWGRQRGMWVRQLRCYRDSNGLEAPV